MFNLSVKCNYNHNLVYINQIQKMFLCVPDENQKKCVKMFEFHNTYTKKTSVVENARYSLCSC